MKRALGLLFLLLPAAAYAQPLKGVVREVQVKGQEHSDVFIDTADGRSYQLTRPEDRKLFFSFRGRTVEVEGQATARDLLPPSFRIDSIQRPEWRESVHARCVNGSSLKRDGTPRFKIPKLQLEGRELAVAGNGLRVLKRAFGRDVHVQGWLFEDDREPELHVTRTRARTTQEGLLHELALKLRGRVAAQVDVWLEHSSLWGQSAWLIGPDGESGYYDYAFLEIGTPPADSKAPSGRGLAQQLPPE